MLAVTLALAVSLGCGDDKPLCSEPEESLGNGVSCKDALASMDYASYLAARPIGEAAKGRLLEEWKQAALRDGPATQQALDATAAFLTSRSGKPFVEGERRARESWDVLHHQGTLAGSTLDGVREHVRKHIGVWKEDETHKIVVSENEVEGWIRYASLGREVQGAPPLRVSMADKVGLYRVAIERYEDEDLQGRIAFITLGAGWQAARDAWMRADYTQQQAWIGAAPLPPPMVGTSPEYFHAMLMAGSMRAHAEVLNTRVAPLLYR